MSHSRMINKLQKIRKGTPSYNMGYRWKDLETGREYTVHPFGFEGQKIKVKK